MARPFEGLADEAEWIALRELVPAASAPLTLAPELVERYGDRPVTLATVLPMAWPAMTKPDGRIFVGLQRHVQSGDVSRDLAVALLCALQTPPGGTVSVPALPGEGPRLQDVLVDAPLDITLHDGFEFWLDDDAGDDPNVKASLERANASIYPTVRLAAARAAYWCRVPDKAHVRWVLPDDEDAALDALSRLAGAGELLLGDEHQVRRHVPRARSARAGLGHPGRAGCRRVGGADGRLRQAVRGRAGRHGAARQRRPPRQAGPRRPPAHPAVS